ncbi:MAG: hypothetical protein JNK61_02895 [Bacteroidia bacterium]|nr:hypothetical protein [Bacteroidia bacterium]
MKTFNLTSVLLFVALAFTACQKESNNPIDFENQNQAVTAAKPAAKKWHIKTKIDNNGLMCQEFNYDGSGKLSSINYAAGLVQNFYYGVTGNLETVEVFDPAKGQLIRSMSYQYNANSNLPELVQVFNLETGTPVYETRTEFEWNAKGQKTKEVTKNMITHVEQKSVFQYANGNATFIRYFVDNAAIGVQTFIQFDTEKNPYKNTTVLALLPGFEFHGKNAIETIQDRNGNVATEVNTITYNNQKLPTSIETSINGSPLTTKQGFTYIKL